ncbi:unnamed protein product [Prunus armeniaca]|uniref:Uncharacterized protein n=1 Tax=Prunus armeniaca TaxID=36596 RepID=A0A6J5WIR0_PRUAR|nr:unnamed protein product [Prunus armeniaca]
MEGDDETSGPMIDDEIYANGVGGDDEKRSRPIISKQEQPGHGVGGSAHGLRRNQEGRKHPVVQRRRADDRWEIGTRLCDGLGLV